VCDANGMVPSDIARLVAVGDPKLSPDGRWVAFGVEKADMDAGCYRGAVWVAASDGSSPPRQVTAGVERESAPAWSPDGRRLAFTRSVAAPVPAEAAAPQAPPDHSLHVVSVDGAAGEVLTVAQGDEPFRDLTWSPDGLALAYAQRVRADGDNRVPDRLRPPRHIDVVFNRLDSVGWTVDRRSHVFVASVDRTSPPRQLTDGPYDHSAPAWSPDGHRIVCAAARHEGWDIDLAVDLWVFDVDGGGAPRCLTDTARSWSCPSWSLDGTRVAAMVGDDRSIHRHTQVAVVDVATGADLVLTAGLDRQCLPYPGHRAPVWCGESLLFTMEDHGQVPVMRVPADGSGAAEVVAAGERWTTGYDASPDGRVLALTTTSSTVPPELFSIVDGTERRLTRMQETFLRDCPAFEPERRTVPSPAGDGDIDTWVVHPPGFDGRAHRQYPMLLQIHGGPMTQHGARWFDEVQMYASAGYVVVYANPHGSTGATEAWARSIRSPRAADDPGTGWGGIDFDDLIAVVDATLAREPAVDPDRLGVLGGSYGGFMTTWILGHTRRFAAGCSERAVNDLWTEELSADIAGAFRHELGIDPFTDADEYRRQSPITYVRGIDTPVLILHSEQDLRCPVVQADELFVALRLLGKQVDYWRFPGESHELSRAGSPVHRRQRAEIVLDWFERWLKP
jgi:dipeptidyl aminopeptidase/acylaminoacyl peptidase